MIVYGLIGNPLTHSLSASYFSSKFRQENISGRIYKLFPLSSIDEFPGLIRREKELAGLNVTIPYKKKIIGFLDEMDPSAEEIGAVNTILISRDGERIKLKGYNTDADGFRLSADFTGHAHALILGTGGAARAVQYALKELGIQCLSVSRNPIPHESIGFSDLNFDHIHDHTLIINATPLGIYPEISSFPPIPYQFLTKRNFLYDLVYNPEMTIFLKKGLERGTCIQNGKKMLQLQAEKSYEIWEFKNNFTPSGF